MVHVIVHYHLRNGGVATVIRREIEALQRLGQDVCLITGQKDVVISCRTIYIHGLDYADEMVVVEGEQLKTMIMDAVTFAKGEIVWHIHNPTLGCHRNWSVVASSFVVQGERVIYHIHDFAEDERKENLEALLGFQELYPVSPRVRYVVLSWRDAATLHRAGLPMEFCYVLPNPVVMCAVELVAGKGNLVLYPTRGIDRKNLGELCLLSALAGDDVRFVTTLHPRQSRQQYQYGFWRDLVRELGLSVDFGVVDEHGEELNHWIRRSTHVISTSRQEGFGMVFLESVAWQRPMIGRAIPHVDADLRDRYEVDHPYLYDHIVDERGRDFLSLSMEDARKWIVSERNGIGHAKVVRHGLEREAREWLAEALSHRDALDPHCLSAFDVMKHGSSLMQIAKEIESVTQGEIRFLDRKQIEEFFL